MPADQDIIAVPKRMAANANAVHISSVQGIVVFNDEFIGVPGDLSVVTGNGEIVDLQHIVR